MIILSLGISAYACVDKLVFIEYEKRAKTREKNHESHRRFEIYFHLFSFIFSKNKV